MFMIEKALVGGRRYWTWTLGLLAVVAVGLLCYLRQLSYGLGITGMSRNVTWGLYIGQFTFLVGIAASAVMVVLPYYLHNRKEFARMAILGEFLAISAVSMCVLFILVDLGQPSRVLNILLYPTPSSIMFWEMVSLGGYLVLNGVIALVTLGAERKGIAPPGWIKPIILLSIPWAISIHTVTAFLYAGLPGRSFWLTAILAPRFLASAFASGPALLILLCMLLRKLTGYDVGIKAIRTLAVILTYALVVNVFFLLMELFTSFYSQIPSLVEHFQIMYTGMQGHASLLLFLGRLSLVLTAVALFLLLIPGARRNKRTLVVACVVTFLSLWIDKGVCLVVSGFMPSPLGTITRYVPTLPESLITVGVWAVGALMITVFYKIALSVRASGLALPVEHGTTTGDSPPY
jgi:molybdopterin-containing oxidoreductase family membrane subunit